MDAQTTQKPKLKSSSRIPTRTLVMIAMLAVIGFLLKIPEIPFPLIPPWLKFDFGDLTTLLGSFALGPIAGVAIVLVKELLFFVIHGSSSGGIGELANFVLGSSFVITAGTIYKYNRTRSGATIGLLAGILVFTFMGVVANIYFLMPFYQKFMPLDVMIDAAHQVNSSINSFNDIVWMGVLPFNIIKGLLTATSTLILYKYVSPFLKPKK